MGLRAHDSKQREHSNYNNKNNHHQPHHNYRHQQQAANMQKTLTRSNSRTMSRSHPVSFTLIIALVAFQALTASKLTVFGQQAEHEHASAAPGGPESAAGAPLAADTAGALASADDLLAAESSQSPEPGAAEAHKAFTSAQMLRQEQAASVAPAAVYAPQQQQPMFAHQQQQPAQHMQGARYQPQGQPGGMHHAHPKQPPHMNPFMAAALAGNYGPAQQQMAAAALHAQQAHHMHHANPAHAGAHHQPHHHHGVGSVPMQAAAANQQQQQQAIAAATHMQPAPQQQQQHAQPAPMVVQESNVRHNVVPAPGIESNAIEQNEPNSVAPSQPTSAQGPQQQQQQLATASSAQHPVIATASNTAVSGQQDSWPLQAPDIPKIVNLEVKCEKNLMKVSVEFDKIFNGVIFSKGHFNQGQCVHVGPNGNKQQAYFDISINSCGTQGNTQNGLYGMGQNTGSGTFFENTIVIQYDPNVQEVYDHARKLRCTWHDQYEKAVTFRPFPVDMLDIVRADFAGDNVGCWMQIQVGKGPWASEVAGIVKIGQTMTMVLAIKDEENKFDMLVRNCFAHDGKRGPIELVDKSGCITRPKLMSRFTKIKNFGSSATVLSYAHFQAFKFPDSMEVHFQCTIQICRHQCPEQCAAGPNVIGGGAHSSAPGEAYSESTISGTFNIHSGAHADAQNGNAGHLRKFGAPALSRERRSAESRWSNGSHHHHHHHNYHHLNPMHNGNKPLTQSVGLNRIIQVVSTGDLAFAVREKDQSATTKDQLVSGSNVEQPAASALSARLDLSSNQICMSSFNFMLALVMLALILLCSCLAAITLYIRQRSLLYSSSSGSQLKSGTSSSSINKHLLHGSSSPQTTPTPSSVAVGKNHLNYPFIHTNVPTQKQNFYPDRR